MSKPVSRRTLAILTGGILVLAVLAILLWLPCPSDPQYVVFRVVLAFGIACLSVLLMGSISLWHKPVLVASGGFAMFFLTLRFLPALIRTDDKCKSAFAYSVRLRDTANQKISNLQDTLILRLGSDDRKAPVTADGIADFKEIPAAYAGAAVVAELQSPGWWFQATRSRSITIPLKGSNSTLLLVPSDLYCCIFGSITNQSGQAIPGVEISIGQLRFKTDSLGYFSITLPVAQQQREVSLRLSAGGYRVKEVMMYPGEKKRADFIMEKNTTP